MANPTTNYSWQMPTSTDLVTDLPADFEVFGQAVDTTVKANADAAIAKTLIDAKGDLIAGTAADAAARLAVGTNGQVLTADSAEATGIKWGTIATGFSLKASGSLTGNTVSITGLSSGEYIVNLNGWSENNSQQPWIRLNNDSGNNYWDTIDNSASNVAYIPSFSPSATSVYATYINIGLANTNSAMKTIGSGVRRGAVWKSTATVTSIQLGNLGTNVWDAGTYEVWGR